MLLLIVVSCRLTDEEDEGIRETREPEWVPTFPSGAGEPLWLEGAAGQLGRGVE